MRLEEWRKKYIMVESKESTIISGILDQLCGGISKIKHWDKDHLEREKKKKKKNLDKLLKKSCILKEGKHRRQRKYFQRNFFTSKIFFYLSDI
ncbi:hypothetical protein RFI_37958 [Reticulomyxa filosa]|uniref:Uncharacterized protein n=1 Tax=Reticulomyxa filosa TaxID=46433 RepID=X6LD92_RETFI|nr:hypothetical protein RFI_37958 [Reticulomyxa filosa]|eukprot:ETN99513.1 hypothetical protein RFI_37958 [Reticulomyxa filosa]